MIDREIYRDGDFSIEVMSSCSTSAKFVRLIGWRRDDRGKPEILDPYPLAVATIHDSDARKKWWQFWRRPSFGDAVKSAIVYLQKIKREADQVNARQEEVSRAVDSKVAAFKNGYLDSSRAGALSEADIAGGEVSIVCDKCGAVSLVKKESTG